MVSAQLFEQLVSSTWFVEALQAKLGTLSLEAQSKLEKDTAAKEAKAEKKADAALKKKMVRFHLILSSFRTKVLSQASQVCSIH